MATAARLPLAAWRNEACVRTIRFVGFDLTGVDLRAQVRLRPDTPGAPLISLATVTNANAEGLRLVDVVTTGGVKVSTVALRINKSTMQDAAKLPFGGESGSDTAFAYAMQFGGVTRVVGQFVALASVMDSDGAQAGTVSGYGSAGSGILPWNTAQLTFGEQTIEISIDGLDLIGPIVADLAAQVAAVAGSAASVAQAQADIDALIDQVGYRYNFVVEPKLFTDTTTPIDRGTHFEGSAYSRVILSTSARRMRVHGFTTIAADPFASFAELGVLVGGGYLRSILATANGGFCADLLLPAGPKQAEVVAGLATKVGGVLKGTWPVAIEADAPIAQLFPPAVDGIYVVGDSIPAGDHADIPTQRGAIPLLRANTNRNIVFDGYGFNTFYEQADSASKRDALVARVVASGFRTFYDALAGRNDYALGQMTPAAFAAAKIALYQALRAAIPNVVIYAQTAIIAKDEAVAVATYRLQDFRDAMSGVGAGRPYVTTVNGKAFMTTAALHDNVHPNTFGQRLLAQGMGQALGIVVPDLPIAVDPLNAGPDTNGEVTQPSAGVYRAKKKTGEPGWNAAFYGEPLTDDFHIQIDLPVALDAMIGINTAAAASNNSDYGDMLHQIYPQQGGGIALYDGPAAVGSAANYVPGDPSLARFHFKRVAGSLSLRRGESYAAGTDLREPLAESRTLALDLSIFRVGEYLDIKRIV